MSETSDLQRRLDAGEALSPGEAATLLKVHRSTVDRLLNRGRLRYTVKPGTGEYREIEPESLRTELARRSQVHGADPEDAQPPSAT
jgi:excisionase family DNA binding protein